MSEDTRSLRGNIFDLRKLKPMRMATLSSLEQNKEYWVVHSKDGFPYTNWRTKIRIKHILNANAIIAECTIMDGNYVFTDNYSMDEYTFFDT